MYRDMTQISHEGTNLNERWPTIGVSSHDSSSHASSNCDVTDDHYRNHARGSTYPWHFFNSKILPSTIAKMANDGF